MPCFGLFKGVLYSSSIAFLLETLCGWFVAVHLFIMRPGMLITHLYFRLIELDEGIETLDAAIEYRTDNIHSRQLEVRQSQAVAQVKV